MDSLALSPFHAAAILMVLTAAFGYLNQKYLGLPRTIGLMMFGAIAALLVLTIDHFLPASELGTIVRGFSCSS